MIDETERDMKGKEAPYYRMWLRRYRPFRDWILYIEFSQDYFEKLKRELESAGYEVTANRQLDCWYSPPVGCFGVSNVLKGESFVFFVM